MASTESATGTRRLELKERVSVSGDTWLAARCGGPDYYGFTAHHDGWGRGVFAHTSPVYVTSSDEWRMFDENTAQYMSTLIDGTLTYIRETATHHAPGTVTHHHGEDDHLAFLERPFLEAREAVQRRLDLRR